MPLDAGDDADRRYTNSHTIDNVQEVTPKKCFDDKKGHQTKRCHNPQCHTIEINDSQICNRLGLIVLMADCDRCICWLVGCCFFRLLFQISSVLISISLHATHRMCIV